MASNDERPLFGAGTESLTDIAEVEMRQGEPVDMSS
jgi:hypothetical protein